jgi:hypothetical protein
MPSVEPYRKVLLVLLADAPSRRVLDAARGLCERMAAGLEIVRVGNRLPDELLQATIKELAGAGLPCEAVQRPDGRIADLVAWANGRACVAAVMLAASDRDMPGNDAQSAADPWQHLACPLVVAGRESIDELK